MQADSNGIGTYSFLNDQVYLYGDYSVIGRTCVLHRKRDDLGMAGTIASLTNGTAGGRISCGVIVDTSIISASSSSSATAIIKAIIPFFNMIMLIVGILI